MGHKRTGVEITHLVFSRLAWLGGAGAEDREILGSSPTQDWLLNHAHVAG